MRRRGVVGDVAAIAAAGWLGVCALVYWRTFGPFPLSARDLRRLTPADFALSYEELEVRTEDGVRLVSWLLPGSRNAVVVVSGGYRGHISDVLGIASALSRAGFSVVAFGWRGTPGSDRAAHTLGALEQRDLTAVLDALQHRLGAVPVGLLGYSMGGAVSISVAAGDPRVRAVCADSAFADPVDLLMERARRRLLVPAAVMIPVMTAMAGRTGARLHEFRPIEVVGRIAPRPLFLIHGDADASVPVEHAHRLLAAAGEPAQLWVLPGVGHVGAYFADRAGYVERVTGFFDSSPRYLVAHKYTSKLYSWPMDTDRGTQALLRHLDAGLGSRPEDELIAQVLGGAEPPAALLATAGRLARLPFWERRALGASGLVRDHRVPPREAIRLAALWELAERWYPDERPAVTTPGAALHLLQGLRNLGREEVWALFLDARHRLISVEPVVAGSLNSARLLPRDVLAPALRAGAAALIVAHNHPSGEVAPSRADRLVTAALRDAARLLGLPLLDHLILTARSHFSFREVEAWETEGATAAA